MMAKVDSEKLRANLDEVPCAPRLYPTRLLALQILTGKKIDELISTRIIKPLSKATTYQGPQIKYRFTPATLKPSDQDGASSIWVNTFIRDMVAYGLREAILYFNAYEFVSDPSSLIDNAVDVYHDIARSYIDNAEKLENSDDNLIKSQLLAAKLYGEGTPQNIKVKIIPPKQKKREQVHQPSKKKLAEMVVEAQSLTEDPESYKGLSPDEILEELGADPGDAQTYKEYLIQFIDYEFMFGGFPGFEEAVLRVAKTLCEYGIEPESEIGQEILKTYVCHAKEEYYGDFYRFVLCNKCGQEFRPDHSLRYVNQVLAREVFCLKCSKV